jgi:hypothetical protein
MVCTIVCVHTILRDERTLFKTGLPDAYELLPELRARVREVLRPLSNATTA